jgi:hypothetical protein
MISIFFIIFCCIILNTFSNGKLSLFVIVVLKKPNLTFFCIFIVVVAQGGFDVCGNINDASKCYWTQFSGVTLQKNAQVRVSIVVSNRSARLTTIR